jgi:hypothetical protein
MFPISPGVFERAVIRLPGGYSSCSCGVAALVWQPLVCAVYDAQGPV